MLCTATASWARGGHRDERAGRSRGRTATSPTSQEVGADSQAIAGWNGAGPFSIVNNYLEAAGENVMFGGADPTIQDLVPRTSRSGATTWRSRSRGRPASPATKAQTWSVKNLLELKNARRVLIDGNLFEGNWRDAQNGFADPLHRAQPGRRRAVVDGRGRHVPEQRRPPRRRAASISSAATTFARARRAAAASPSATTSSPTSATGGAALGALLQILNGAARSSIEHNTALQTGSILVAEGAPQRGVRLPSEHRCPHNEYG